MELFLRSFPGARWHCYWHCDSSCCYQKNPWAAKTCWISASEVSGAMGEEGTGGQAGGRRGRRREEDTCLDCILLTGSTAPEAAGWASSVVSA